MSRYSAHINPLTGTPECLYAGCGREIPADHYLCRNHYAKLNDGLLEPCPGRDCDRFKSTEYALCADCATVGYAESEPSWEAGDEDAEQFFAYLMVSPAGDWYAGHTRSLRNRMWWHSKDQCRTTAGQDFQLVWFSTHDTRSEAAEREVELKRLIVTRPYAILDLVFEFQEVIALVQPFPDATGR